MAAFIMEGLAKSGLKFDLIVPVPSHVKRIRQRGYSQAGLIALKLSEMTDIPCVDMLCKIKDTRSQVLFNGEDRWYNVKDAFALNADIDCQKLKGQRVLLLDDKLLLVLLFITAAASSKKMV
jgi:competence protein ComFC